MIRTFNLLKIFNLFLAGGLLVYSLSTQAGFYDAHARGWHWYEKNAEVKEEEVEKDFSALPPLEAIKAIKIDLDTKRAKALLAPTEQNVYDYIKTQEIWANKAEQFSKTWQWVITQHPELNYNLQHPTSELAKRVAQEEKSKGVNEAITYIKEHFGLFYFYRSDCAYCEKFSPILKAFGERYQLQILAISLDGKPNSVFKTFRADNGIAQKWGVQHVPALFAISPEDEQVIPIAFGLISQNDLEQRFLSLAEFIKEKKHVSVRDVSYKP